MLATLRGRIPGTAHLVQLGDCMALKPLGHRILVKPDMPPEQTDSGLVLPGDRDHVPVSGTVIAVGAGPEKAAKIRAASIARCIRIVEELAHDHPTSSEVDRFAADVAAELGRYKNHAEHIASDVAVWDRVVYPAESGLKITEDGIDYIILNEDDAVVIATEEAVA